MTALLNIWHGMIRIFPALIIVLSIIFYISYYNVSDPKLAQAFLGSANAMLMGGVFAAVLKVFQFMGIFKNELQKVMYSDELLGTRNNKNDILKKVMLSMCDTEEKKDMATCVHEKVTEFYIPTEIDCYYEKLRIHITLNRGDNNDIMLESHVEIEIVPSCKEQVSFLLHSSSYAESDKHESKFWYSTTKGAKKKELLPTPVEYKEPASANRTKYGTKYEINLEISKPFTLFRETTHSQDLSVDRYFRFLLNKHVKRGMEVTINHPVDMMLQFVGSGVTQEFQTRTHHKKGQMSYYTTDTILPNQGFVLIFD